MPNTPARARELPVGVKNSMTSLVAESDQNAEFEQANQEFLSQQQSEFDQANSDM